MATKRGSVVIPTILFTFGIFVVVLGLILLMPRVSTGISIFVTVDVILLYALIMGPLLFNDALNEVTGGRLASLAVYFKAAVVYTLLTAGVLYVTLFTRKPPIGLLLVLQLAGLCGMACIAVMSLGVSRQATEVAHEEAKVRASVDNLRAASTRLATQASHLDARDAEQRELINDINRISEELRYISPIYTQEALTLEEQIASYVNSLVTRVRPDMSSMAIRAATQDAQQALMLIDHRKNVRY